MPDTSSIFSLSESTVAGVSSYYADGTGGHPVSVIYVQDINRDGLDEVFFAAFESQPTTPQTYDNTSVVIYGWRDGVFQDVTQQWLPNDASQVQGVGDICFGDFDGNGWVDVFLSAYTDMVHPAHRYALMNNGTVLERVDLGVALWDHAAAAADVNQDGYTDVLLTGYNLRSNLMGSSEGLLHLDAGVGGSGLAIGDYLGDGTMSVIYSDSSQALAQLYSVEMANGRAQHEHISDLPMPRIEANSHDIRVRNLDFDHDGLLDVVVFSWQFPSLVPNTIQSEIQFLKNLGAGEFVDVTDSLLVGYDRSGNVGYFPQILDVNQDGLLDIFTSNRDWLPEYRSTSLLIQQDDGTFVASGSELLRAVVGTGAQGVLARGPEGSYYLVTESAWQFSSASFLVSWRELNFSSEVRNTVMGTVGADKLLGTVGHDDIYGLAGNDHLTDTLGGNDYLDGGLGVDVMAGGGGDDIYVVDQSKDRVTEKNNQGNDEVRSSISYTLGSYLECLTLTGSASINGLGNTLANTLTGNTGNNLLNGGAGADTLIGAAGDDTYLLDDLSDVVIEVSSQGVDTVQSTVSVSGLLADDASCAYVGVEVENFTLLGTASIHASGNALANTLLGNQNVNRLIGLAGDDSLNGALGNDLLWGGEGRDSFVFNTKLGTTNRDTLYDFNVSDDVVYLENAIFKKLTQTGALSTDYFWQVGSRAQDANDYLTFNTSTGVLSYDADGSGRAAATVFAIIDIGGLSGSVSATDFWVI